MPKHKFVFNNAILPVKTRKNWKARQWRRDMGKGKWRGNYLMRHPQWNVTMDGSARLMIDEEGRTKQVDKDYQPA